MEHKIFSNLITRVISDTTKIRGMISCLGRNDKIKTTTTMLYINKLNKTSNEYQKKLESCKVINLKDALEYLEKEEKENSPLHQKTRRTWLKMLRFINENIELLNKLHKDPNGKDILDKIIEEKTKIEDIKHI